MATCRVCSATLTDNPAEINGSYGESRSGITLLESQVSKAIGESLCTYHWMQVLEGNDNTAVANAPQSHNVASHSDTTGTGAELNTLTENSMADALHRHSELSASDGTPDQSLIVAADGHITFVGKAHADATPIGLDVLRSAVVGINLDVGQNITVDGTVDGVDIAARDHAESHTVVSHSDTTATGANLNTLVGGGETALHSHASDMPADFANLSDAQKTFIMVYGI